MANKDGIFSIRVVIADFYMEKPKFGLDPCYSEFRGNDIKKVPIVRIFGSTANGQKACMHVHGVFPYFYIPYEKKDFESVNKAIYQIAINVDKAINTSLGQSTSNAQHVFKVQLVKGIPFYGYHRSDHQFLKIYMFNPRFVRRAANLLQNGAILGKNFQPHESHVPYILQFMIDFNLYGMSFLYVPLEIVKFRKTNNEEEIPFEGIQSAQILNTTIAKKQTITSLEIDIGSNFILNRFQIIIKSNKAHTNPGIESIWHDEKLRREQLQLNSDDEDCEKHIEIPPLEIPTTQERPNVQPTESEVFYRTALLSKLMAKEASISGSASLANQSIDCTLQTNISNITLNAINLETKEKKRTFNLKKVLGNAVYPEECTQDDKLTNASFIENHLSNNSIFQTTSAAASSQSNRAPNTMVDESIFLDDTIVDEDLIMRSLTPQEPHVPLNASLRAEDMKLLDILEQLEGEGSGENDNQIDLDSTLAPLSQQHTEFVISTELLNMQNAAIAANQPLLDIDSINAYNNADDDGLHDFSIALDDIDELILKLTPSQPTQTTKNMPPPPQIDGSDDLLWTPTKSHNSSRKSKQNNADATPPCTPKTPKNRTATSNASPTRSPRTPKSNAALKYAQLPLIYTNKSEKKNIDHPAKKPSRLSLQFDVPTKSKASLRKRLALSEMRRKSICIEDELPEYANISEPKKTPSRRTRKPIDLDKTHITCALVPQRKSDRLLKVYNAGQNQPKDNANLQEEKAKGTKSKISKPLSHVKVKRLEYENTNKSTKTRKKYVTTLDTKEAQTLKHNENVIGVLEKAVNITETAGKSSPTIKDISGEEEIAASDNESTDNSRLRSNLTPNLKRLRRSFLAAAANGSKRKKSSACNGILTSNILADNAPKSCISDTKTAANAEPKTPSSVTKTAADLKLKTPTSGNSSFNDEDAKVTSFYEKSFSVNSPTVFSDSLNSPSIFSEISSPALVISIKSSNSEPEFPASLDRATTLTTPSTHSAGLTSSATEHIVIVTPLDQPPTYEEVLASCRKFEIAEHEFQKPYYSNPDDITKQKEIGYTVLQIPGNKLNDCPEFQSVLGVEVKGLTEWRRKKLLEIGGPAMLNRFRGSQQIREYFATNKRIAITPYIAPPTVHEAKVWLKAREFLKIKEYHDDSPIKVRRQKVTMMLNDGNTGHNDDDIDCSTHSITLTPMTPVAASVLNIKSESETFTPLSSTVDSSASVVKTAKPKRRSRRAKLSLNAQLKAASVAEKLNLEAPKLQCIPTENLVELGGGNNCLNSQLSHSNDTTDISSQTVLAELERSSFVKQLKSGTAPLAEHDVSFGLSSASLDNTFGFKVNLENLQQAKSDIEYNYLTTITLEVFVPTRAHLYPNPERDEMRCIFYAIENSVPISTASSSSSNTNEHRQLPSKACGYIIVNDCNDAVKEGKIHGIDTDIQVKVVKTEIEAIEALLELCALWDPDIYAGYEIEMASWGYVMERAKYLSLNIAPLLSRVPSQKTHEFVDEDREHFTDLDFEMKLCGRILLDVWRLMRSEIALTSYSFENVMYHILHKRGPWHSFRDLTEWFASPTTRWIVIEYYLERVRGTLALLDQLDLIGRTSEMAKLIGIQFYEVLSRGSQFRVESMMLRIAKPKNIVPASPSVQQRAHMRAPEYLPLILEPQSRFYADPVIVLDFQSLYPSMIIGYNYCFSTCLGRVEHLGSSTPFEFGASQLRISPAMLRKLVDHDLITISPCGVAFIKSSVREGILPRMLTEILDTRLMVKQSMKIHKSNSALQRILHSRQLGLKLMANVTYGYTAANFSGRMPAVEVGDSVVAKGRETLERAIKLVHANDKWNVKVVYGDTDSMFVVVPGRTRAEAFIIGAEIAEAVTQDNPQPVKLKLEKVYQPCILQTKKRYVGYMYETADQAEPVYEAKGIETVRRDGCPAVAKMLEKVLRILFESADVSQVKHYVCRQFTKLLSGRANLQDLIFAKEFRGLNGYKPTACVPALDLTRKWLQTDPRHIPRCGERVPFIIINGPPGVPLIRLVRSPHEVLADEGYKINAIYYITKAIIPPLNRCLLLIGADVNDWFANLPRKLLMTPALSTANELIATSSNSTNAGNLQSKKSTISQYFSTTNCIVDCGRQTKHGICSYCERKPLATFVTVQAKIGKIERGFHLTEQICQACCGRVANLNCGSLDCPVLYVLEVKRRELKQKEHFCNLLQERFKNQ